MLSKWLTSVEENGVKVETVIEKTELVEGDILNGSVYVTAHTEEHQIDYISLKVLCEELDGEFSILGKHSFQLVGGIRSKDGEIIPFEIIPDERVCGKDEELILQTTVVFLDGVAIEEQGVITYSAIE